MATELVPSQLGANSTLEKRIERVLDLTRRLKLLEDLLCTRGPDDGPANARSVFPGWTRPNSMTIQIPAQPPLHNHALHRRALHRRALQSHG